MVQAEKAQPFSSGNYVCIVLHCRPKYWDTYGFDFYILDPTNIASNDEYADIKPTIRYKASKSDSKTAAFCALNSTLYMFEGESDSKTAAFCALNSTLYMFEGDVKDRDESGQGRRAGTFAGKFETTPQILAGSDYEIERKDLHIIKPMHHIKISPIALPTPDGQGILVFSAQSYSRYDSFELYNVAHNSWTLLPPLIFSNHDRDSFRTSAYGFETESRFVILSNNVKYVLNLQTMCWVRSFISSEYGDPRLEGYLLGIDGFYFTPFKAYDVTDLHRVRIDPCPLSDFPDVDPYYDVYDGDDRECDYYLNHRSGIPPLALLGHECDGVYDIGVVQAKRPPKSEWPSKSYKFRVILDVFRINFEKLKGQSMRIDGETSTNEENSIDDENSIDEETSTDEENSIDDENPIDEETSTDEDNSVDELNTTVTKTVKLMIDFDFDTYTTGQMYLFSI